MDHLTECGGMTQAVGAIGGSHSRRRDQTITALTLYFSFEATRKKARSSARNVVRKTVTFSLRLAIIRTQVNTRRNAPRCRVGGAAPNQAEVERIVESDFLKLG